MWLCNLYCLDHYIGKVLSAKQRQRNGRSNSITSHQSYLLDPIGTHNMERRAFLLKKEDIEAIRGTATKSISSTIAILQQLPSEIQTHIFSHLNYQSCLASRRPAIISKRKSVCRAQSYDKYQFVIRAEWIFCRTAPPKTFLAILRVIFAFAYSCLPYLQRNNRTWVYIDKAFNVVPGDAVNSAIHMKLLRPFCSICGLVMDSIEPERCWKPWLVSLSRCADAEDTVGLVCSDCGMDSPRPRKVLYVSTTKTLRRMEPA